MNTKILELLNKKLQEQNDEAIIKFLKNNDYSISDKPTIKEIEELKNKLATEDKQIDFIDFTLTNYEEFKATRHVIPFFNSISNPIGEEEKAKIMEMYIKTME